MLDLEWPMNQIGPAGTYLVDVLQRIATHPAAQVDLLTPRLWKENFAAHPLRSDIALQLPCKADSGP